MERDGSTANEPLIEPEVLRYSYPKRTLFCRIEPISCSIYGETNVCNRGALTSVACATCEFKLFCEKGVSEPGGTTGCPDTSNPPKFKSTPSVNRRKAPPGVTAAPINIVAPY